MFFTQNDYKKIQQWLIKNSVKDTEFNEANIPFNGNEIVSIVQGDQNKKVFLKDLVSQIFNLGISDFINITDKYNAPNISLEEAIKLIPSRARKEGQVITFLDEENHWYIYQFKGALNQWNILEQWKDLFESIYVNSILPDEEDLTKSLPDENGNSYLSFKNKRHNKLDFSGLGKVYLRKNIINGVNTLLQKDINRDNTIYVIQYDYDLNGATIEVPNGCVLDFEGGSISNGMLVGNFTTIKENPVQIFGANLTLSGTWNVEHAYPEWFGAKGDGVTDDAEAIQKAVNSFNCVHLINKSYALKSLNESGICISVPSGHKLYGEKYVHSSTDTEGTLMYKGEEIPKVIVEVNAGVELRDLSVVGLPDKRIVDFSNAYSACIKSAVGKFVSQVQLHNVMTQYGTVGIELQAYLSSVTFCKAHGASVGFYIHGALNSNFVPNVEGTSITMYNCYAIMARQNAYRIIGITYSSFFNLAADSCGHDISKQVTKQSELEHPYYLSFVRATNIFNCGVETSLKFLFVNSSSDITVSNCNMSLGWHVEAMYNENYTPTRAIDIRYAIVKIDGLKTGVGGVNASSLSDKIRNNPYGIIYIEDNKVNLIKYSFYGYPEYFKYNDAIQVGGYLNRKSIFVEDRNIPITDNAYEYSSGSIKYILEGDDIQKNTNDYITISLSHSGNVEGGYGATFIDLKGKTVVLECPSKKVLTLYGQPGLYFKNGTVIFRNFILNTGDTRERNALMTAVKTNILFENCEITNVGIDYSSGYFFDLQDTESFVTLFNSQFSNTGVLPLAKSGFYAQTKDTGFTPEYGNSELTFNGATVKYKGYIYTAVGDGISNLTLPIVSVESLPVFPVNKEVYRTDVAFKGVTVFYQNKLVSYNGTNWVDSTGTPITE